VRRAGEPQSWLINKNLDTAASPDQWLRKQVIDVSADRIQSAEVAIGKAKPYSALKKSRADADFVVEGLPKGKELSSPSAADSFATALAGLTLTDVQSATAVSGTPDARATLKTFDGLVTEASGWKKDDKHYIALKTSFDAAHAERFKVATAAETEKKEADAPQGEGAPPAEKTPAAEPAKSAATNVADEASSTNAKLTGWVYEIPAYKYDAIFKPLDELIKK
jgi:glucan-binding YG repeat protein